MKILYLSCHEVLEFDEISMLSDIGVQVFSIGAYLDPARPTGGGLRPALPNLCRDEEDLLAYQELIKPAANGQLSLTWEFVARFDAVIVMHIPDWIEINWLAFGDVPVIWRSIGQSWPTIESRLQSFRDAGMKIVRYSPRERTLDGYCGEDAVIRFGKPSESAWPWKGTNRRVVNFNQNMRSRGDRCRYELFREVTAPFECDLFGGGNEDVPDIARGIVSQAQQQQILSDWRVFFCTGTYPASYTLSFLEAWLAGIPVVAIGRRLWENFPEYHGELYEIPDLIQNGVNGFVSDDVSELQQHIRRLLDDDELAHRISQAGRESAKCLFDKSVIQEQWRNFLKVHVPAPQPRRLSIAACEKMDRELFVSRNGWFDRLYRTRLDGRFPTMKLAFNLLLQRQNPTVVETGCIRLAEDYGAGCSTVLFCEFLHRYGGCLFSVDITQAHVELAAQLTSEWMPVRELFLGDSIHFLESTLRAYPRFPGTIDLLYLDSLDYPLQQLLDLCGRDGLPLHDDEAIAARYAELVLPPQQHCLAELRAARSLLTENSIVLIDDNDLPGGGKSRLARQQLQEWGWICLLDLQQTIWMPGKARRDGIGCC